MIVGVGSDSADIMFISDYGMKEDAIHGYALSGSQETTLARFLKQAHFNVKSTYRTAYIKDILEYDGKNKKQKFLAIQKAHTSALAKGLSYDQILRDEILSIRPNIIVPLGDMSLKLVSGYQPITSYRGSVLPLTPIIQNEITDKTIRVIGTYSPRMTWENPTSSVYVQLDYNKIVKLHERADPIETPGSIWVCRNVQHFREFLDRSWKTLQAASEKERYLVFDIETYLGIPTAISFCCDGKESVSIPLLENKVDYANSFLLYLEIAKVLQSSIGKVNQNIKYDWTILERFGLPVKNVEGDTSVGFHLLYPELPKNLGFQASIYTDLPYFKDESNKKEIAFNPKLYTRDSLYLYNAKDSLATWQIHRKQQDELEEAGVAKLYKERLVPLILIYKDIDGRGLRVDKVVRKRLLGKYKSLLDITTLRFIKACEPVVKFDDIEEAKSCIASYVKLGKLIYDVLKFPPRYKTTEGGKKSFLTDKETLDELMIRYPESNKLGGDGARILSFVVAIKKIVKVIEYIKSPLHPDGTLKCSYNLSGTENARTSASKTIDQLIEFDKKGKLIWPMKKLGRSLQTITKHGFEIEGELFDAPGDNQIGADLRTMFVPRHGYVFVEGDGSSAESRVVAVLAEDYEMLRSHDIKPKIHARTAAMLFDGVKAEDITKEFPIIPGIGMTYYDMGKRTRHAGHLGATEFRLAQLTHVDLTTCRIMMKKFHDNNPKIRGIFHYETYEAVKKTGQLRSPFGRVRQFFDKLTDKMAKEIYANLPQSTVSDQTKFTLIPLSKQAPWAFPVYEGHDALMLECPIGQEKELGSIFKENYEVPIDFRNCSLSRDVDLIIPAELSVGENWSDMEDLKV